MAEQQNNRGKEQQDPILETIEMQLLDVQKEINNLKGLVRILKEKQRPDR